MTTLYDTVMRLWVHQCIKHGLHPSSDEYAQQQFNRLSPSEQLKEISDALEELVPYWVSNCNE